MRIHLLAMVAFSTVALVTGCDSARELSNANVHSNAFGCDQCHGYPPPPFVTTTGSYHPSGVTAPMCTVCHSGTVQADGHTMVPNGEHRDGQVQRVDPRVPAQMATLACDSCHATPPDIGRHLFHVNDRGLTCDACHKGYVVGAADVRTADPVLHMNGKADVVLGPGFPNAAADGVVIDVTLDASGKWPDSACNDCHSKLAE